MNVSIEAIRAATQDIRGHVVRTPLTHSRTLSRITGADVYLKWENLQFTASFKERGALVKLLSLSPEEKARGVIAMSAGNHAQGVAYHAQRLGMRSVIVMPLFTPNVKVEHTRAFGAEVVLQGEDVAEAGQFARSLAAERKLVFVHPYDDASVIAGQGTIALEMLEDQPGLDDLVIPIGGGGLIAGNAIAAKGLKPGLRVYGVESSVYPAMAQALAGKPIACGSHTLAEGIAVREPGSLTLPVVKELVEKVLLVDEEDIERAVLMFLEIEKMVVEGAGAVGLAALLESPQLFEGRKVGLVVGGGNIDMPVLSAIILRGLARSGRMVRLSIEIRDVPGSLSKVADCIAQEHGNIVEVFHQRSFTKLPVRSAELQVIVQTRGPEHVRAMVARLNGAGFATTLPDADVAGNFDAG
jgi:threonine dehydratase